MNETAAIVPAPAEVAIAPDVAADVPSSWVAAMRLASRIHSTPFVPKALRGDPASVLACILTGEELGLGPMQSLRMVHVIEGRPSASAELMRALVNRAGHRVDVVEARQDTVTLSGQRKDTGARATVTWTLADAKRAGIDKNPAWGKYPRSMLLARATSELCRMLFADVISGLYTPEENAAIEGTAWEPAAGELVDPVTARVLPDEYASRCGNCGGALVESTCEDCGTVHGGPYVPPHPLADEAQLVMDIRNIMNREETTDDDVR